MSLTKPNITAIIRWYVFVITYDARVSDRVEPSPTGTKTQNHIEPQERISTDTPPHRFIYLRVIGEPNPKCTTYARQDLNLSTDLIYILEM